MTAQTRAVNKGRFEDGDKPPGSSYVDLMDSFISIADTTAQVITSDFGAPKGVFTTEVSSPQVNATEVSASAGRFTEVIAASARISGNMSVSGSGTFGDVSAGTVAASALSTPIIDGPVQVGPSSERGRLVLIQQADISGNNTKKSVTLPGGSDIVDIKFRCRATFQASAGSTVDIMIGTSADEVKFARFANVSGVPWRHLANDGDVSGLSSVSVASAVIVVGATGMSGAIASAGRGFVDIHYIQKQ